MLRGLRRAAVILIVVSLVAAAGLGIAVLFGTGFGDVQGKILVTTLVIAAFSITALCHLAIVGRALRVVGWVGIAASLGALVAALVLIWSDGSLWSSDWWKALWILTVLAVTLAQANLLLLFASRQRTPVRVALWGTLGAMTVVAVMIWVPILTDGRVGDGDAYWRWFGAFAILDALGTILVPILGLLLKDTRPGVAVLSIELPTELAERLRARAQAAGQQPGPFAAETIRRALDEP